MIFTRIESLSHPLYSKCREIYCKNFPKNEQREEQEQKRILEEYDNYFLYALTPQESPETVLGLLAFWRFKHCYFAEHLAIDDSFKGLGYGSTAIEFLKEKSDDERIPLLLEAEVPHTEEAVRRIAFYNRLELDINDIHHFQPPFHKGDQPLEMKLMTYPYLITEKEYNIFKDEYHSIMPNFNVANKFAVLGLGNNIVTAINELGFERPTPVQKEIIPTILEGKQDIVCLAQTGTGKTAAFGLPTLQKIEERLNDKFAGYEEHKNDPDKKWYSFAEKKTQVLVLSPTRELCKQIAQDLTNYSKYIEGVSVVPVYGGANIEAQIRLLRKTPQIIVATPGRMLDLIKKKAADISGIHTLVLDEADEMLNMGFKEELDAILESAPQNKRSLLFSATLPTEVESIAKSYMKEYTMVTVGERNSGSDNVEHYYYTVHEKERYAALKRIADFYPDIYGIIFCRTKKETQEIADSLIRDGYDADALHGDLAQGQRDMVMGRFKKRHLHLLVATDVAARGIDVNNLTHVINYNLPDEVEQYTHRSGRTGRADKSGVSIVIINTKELHKIRRIEQIIGKTFNKARIPSGAEVCSKQLLSLIDRIDNISVSDEASKYISMVEQKWESLSKQEIIEKFIACEFNRFIEYYKNAPDLNIPDRKSDKKSDEKSRKDKEERASRREKGSTKGEKGDDSAKRNRKGQKMLADDILPEKAEKGYKWIKMNIGDKHRITTRHIIRMMTSIGVGKRGIGKIDIRSGVCYVSISSRAAEYVVTETNDSEYRGHKLKTGII